MKLSDRASKWLVSQPPDTANKLVELAAADSWLSKKIAIGLTPKPLKKRGPKDIVTDDELMELRDAKLTYAAIAQKVGLSRTQVGSRIRKIKENQK
jgi:hypothetical protein